MGWLSLRYLVPYLISLATTIAVAGYAWRHRTTAGARSYALAAMAGALGILGYVFEPLSPSLEAKIFGDNVLWMGTFAWSVALLIFTLEYAGRQPAPPWRAWGLLIVGTLILLVGTTLTLAGMAPASHLALWPLTSALGNLIVIWSLLRYRPFDLAPAARGAASESTRAALDLPVATVVGQAETAERQIAEEALQRRTEELEALRQMALEITAQLDLDTLLHSTVSRAVELLDGTIGEFYLYRPDWNLLEMVVAIGTDPALVGTTLCLDEGLAGKVWQADEPIVVEDYQHWAGRQAAFDIEGFRATVGAPVRWGEKFLGVLAVAAGTPGVFLASDAELLSLLATQAATAIQNARLFQKTQQQLAELALLFEISAAVSASLDVDVVLDTIARRIASFLNVEGCAISVWDREQDVVITLSDYAPDLVWWEPDPPGTTYRLDDYPATRRVLTECQPIVVQVSDPSADPREVAWMVNEDLRSMLMVPLIVRGEAIGYLELMESREERAFTATEIALCLTLASQAAASLEHARLFQAEREQRQFAEAQAIENARLYEAEQRQAREAAAVGAIAQVLNATTDLTHVFPIVARHLRGVVDFDRLSVALLDDGEERFTMYALSAQPDAPLAPGLALPLAATAAAGDILSGRPHFTPDLSAELDFAAERALYDSGLRSRLNLPLLLGGTVVGALNLTSQHPGAFSSDQLPLLTQVADAIAAAVQNAQLYDETLRRNRELALLNRVIAASATGQEIDTILETACRELAHAFDLPHSAAVRFDGDKTEAVVVAGYRLEDSPLRLGQAIPLASMPLLQNCLQYKSVLVIEDARTDPRLGSIFDLSQTDETLHILILPLLGGEDVEGILGLAGFGPRSFTSEEIALVQRVADQVSGAVTRACLEDERRALEKQLQQVQRMEALGRLAGGIAHDFNNLLTAIQLSTQLIQRQLHHRDPLRNHVQQIQETGERATRLVKQLLSFSRRDIVESRLLTLDDIIHALSPMLRRIIGEDVELNLSLARDLWPIKADPSQIEQLIVNLAVNARDAMPQGGTLTIETANIVVDRAQAAAHVDVWPGEHVRLIISDTGVGMDAEVQAHIFEPFFTTKETGKGTGLGLSTVFGIVTQAGGYIHVSSEVGQGTTFTIYLPHALETGTVEPPSAFHPSADQLVHGTETILVAEDEAAVRNQAVQVLESYGYRVLAAEDGVHALEISQQHDDPIQLLLTDVVMPRLGGVDLVEKLRSQRPGIRVLYMSGYAPDTVIRRGVLDGGVALLSKPFTLESLVHKVRTVLDDGG